MKAMSLAELRTHKSAKWRDFPSDILPLPVAEMDFPVAAPIRELLMQMVSKSDLGYLGSIPELAIAFASFSSKRWNWSVDTEQVHIATDVGVGVVEILRVLAKPGDKVLINSPVYHNFSHWISEVNLEKVDVPFHQQGKEWSLDFTEIEEAYRSGIKAHLLCSPHNPLGRVYSREELMKFAELANRYSVVIISDEIHGPLTFSDSKFIPFLSLGPDAESVGITVTAASKAWNIAGLKCAILVSQSDQMNELLRKLPIATHYRASLLGAFATATAFTDGEEWLDAVVVALDDNRKLLGELLKMRLPKANYVPPQNGYLAWIDFSEYEVEEPARRFLERGRVAVLAGGGFGSHTPNFVRLNFATSPEILSEAVERMAVALE